VWIDRRGRVLVADRRKRPGAGLRQNGKFLNVWADRTNRPAFFYVDADDAVYIPEHNGGMISILTLRWRAAGALGDGR